MSLQTSILLHTMNVQHAGNTPNTNNSSTHQHTVLPSLPGCDHCPTKFQYVFAGRQSSSSSQPHISQHPNRSWHKGKYRAISEHLASIDWDLELYCLNANACYKHLTTILHRLIDEHVPVKPPPSTNNPRWLKRPPSSLLNRRHAAWIRYKSVRAELGLTC